jgi:MFS superfamily sulfate permease-like transporter
MTSTQTSKPEAPAGLRRWLPGVQMLASYQRGWLVKDVIAGIVLTAVLIPVGMGYSQAAGLPAIYGLYATIIPMLAYALVGPSRILVVGPDSSLAGIIFASIVPLAAGDPGRAVDLAGMLALLSGAFCILAGLARLGFVTDLLSKPIRFGFLNGIALTVLVGQTPKILGFSAPGENIAEQITNMVKGLAAGKLNWTTFLIGAFSLATILLFKKWVKKIPGVLVAVVAQRPSNASATLCLSARYSSIDTGSLRHRARLLRRHQRALAHLRHPRKL